MPFGFPRFPHTTDGCGLDADLLDEVSTKLTLVDGRFRFRHNTLLSEKTTGFLAYVGEMISQKYQALKQPHPARRQFAQKR